MGKFYPPVLEQKAYSIPYNPSPADSAFDIYFNMPTMNNGSDLQSNGHVQVIIKTQSNNEPAVNTALSPDKQILYISGDSKYLESDLVDDHLGVWKLSIPYTAFNGGFPALGVTYTVQVRFGDNKLWSDAGTGLDGSGFKNFSAWRQSSVTTVPSQFGEWSNVQTVFVYGGAAITVEQNIDDFVPELRFYYNPVVNDPLEQIKMIYTYSSLNGQVVKNQVYDGAYAGDNAYTLTVKLPIAPVTDIFVSFEGITSNNTVVGKTFTIRSIRDNNPLSIGSGLIKDSELKGEENGDGVLAKDIYIPSKNPLTVAYNIYRVNVWTLDTVKVADRQDFRIGNDNFNRFKDYTVEMGEDYQYIVCGVNTQGVCIETLIDIFDFGPTNAGYGRLTRMDSSYLTTAKHQLRLQGNVVVSSFKRESSGQYQTTLGSQYPYYQRGGKQDYRTLQISALITINFDPTATFMRLKSSNWIEITDSFKQDSSVWKGWFVRKLTDPDSGIYIVDRDFTATGDWQIDSQYLSVSFDDGSSNGLYWDDDNGSSLEVFERDIFYNQEFSLTRRRVKETLESAGDELLQQEVAIYPETGLYHGINSNTVAGPRSIYSPYLHKERSSNYGTDRNDGLVFMERKFREFVMQWLNDGKPKLFRSETEGNMIVGVTSISFSPFEKSDRSVYTMSATLTEIAEYNLENLLLYNLVPNEIVSTYIESSPWEFNPGSEDPAAAPTILYKYLSSYDIPNTLLGVPIAPIDTFDSVRYGLPPFTFSSTGLPTGISIDSTTGVVSGTPTEESIPRTATLTVTDTLGYSSSIIINIGYLYSNLTFNPILAEIPNMVTAVSITPIDVGAYVSHGVRPYRFSANNLPTGIILDENTGVVSGSFTFEVLAGQAQITVVDHVGQVRVQSLNYGESSFPIQWIDSASYDIPYSEVGTPIVPIDTSISVSEGFPPYTYSSQGLPAGISINGSSGILSGTPTTAMSAGTATLTARDSEGHEVSIIIAFERVLATFTFTYSEDYDIPTYMIGTEIEPIYLMPTAESPSAASSVLGGLTFTTGAPYRFTATGLSPSYSIDDYGVISGEAIVGKDGPEGEPPHQYSKAIIKVRDARGHEKTMYYGNISTNDFSIEVGDILSPIIFGNSASYQLPSVVVYNSAMNPIPAYGFRITTVSGGIGKYTFSATGLPSGVSINPDTGEIYGYPTATTAATTGRITVTDEAEPQNIAFIDFPIGGVYNKLEWTRPVGGIVVPRYQTEQSITPVLLQGISGGMPPYSIHATTDLLPYVLSEVTNIMNPNNISIQGQSGTVVVAQQDFNLTVTDNLGQQVLVQGTRKEIYLPLTIVPETLMEGLHLIKNWSTIETDESLPVEIVSAINGPSGDFPITFNLSGRSEVMPGISLATNGTINGSPNAVHSPESILNTFRAYKDGVEGRALASSKWVTPTIHERLIRWDGQTLTNPVIAADRLAVGIPYLGEQYILEDGYPNTRWELRSPAPPGISLSDSHVLHGTPTEVTALDTDVRIAAIRPAGLYTPAEEYEVTVRFPPVAGKLVYTKVPSDLRLHALAIGVFYEGLIVSDGLAGGYGPYTWEATGLPTGLEIMGFGSDNRQARIQGTPTSLAGAAQITITVRDSTGSSGSITIDTVGIFEPIIFPDSESYNIPPKLAYQDIAPINVNNGISGGTGIYTFSNPNSNLFPYTISENGVISGNSGAYGYPERLAKIRCTDSNGLVTGIDIIVGEITGSLQFNYDPAIHDIPADNAYEMTKDIVIGASVFGGVPPYSYQLINKPSWLSDISSTGIIPASRRPGSYVAASSLNLKIVDADGQEVFGTINIGEVFFEELIAYWDDKYIVEECEASTDSAAVDIMIDTVDGGTKPYIFSSSDLPAGLSITSDGHIFGTVTEAVESFNAVINIADSAFVSNTTTLNIKFDKVWKKLYVADGFTETVTLYVQEENNLALAGLDFGGLPPYSISENNLPTGISSYLVESNSWIDTIRLVGNTSDLLGPISNASLTLQSAAGTTQTVVLNMTLAARAMQFENLPYIIPPYELNSGLEYGETILITATGGRKPYRVSANTLPEGVSVSVEYGDLIGAPISPVEGYTTDISFTDSDNLGNTTISTPIEVGTIYSPLAPSVDTVYMVMQERDIQRPLLLPSSNGGLPPFTIGINDIPAGLDIANGERQVDSLEDIILTGVCTATTGEHVLSFWIESAAGVRKELETSIYVWENLKIVYELADGSPALEKFPSFYLGNPAELYPEFYIRAEGGSGTVHVIFAENLPTGVTLNTSNIGLPGYLGKIEGYPTALPSADAPKEVAITILDNVGNSTIEYLPIGKIDSSMLPTYTVIEDIHLTIGGASRSFNIGQLIPNAIHPFVITYSPPLPSWIEVSNVDSDNLADMDVTLKALSGATEGVFSQSIYIQSMGGALADMTTEIISEIRLSGRISSAEALMIFNDSSSYDLPKMEANGLTAVPNVTPLVTGGTIPYIFSAEGLPEGVTIDSVFGNFVGIPTKPTPPGEIVVTVTDSNPVKEQIQVSSITVTHGEIVPDFKEIPALPTIKIAESELLTYKPFTDEMATTIGGLGPFVATFVSGQLPDGLTMTATSGELTELTYNGTVYGDPNLYSATYRLTSASGRHHEYTINIEVEAAKLTASDGTLPEYEIGSTAAYDWTSLFQVSGGVPPYTFDSTFPEGVSLDGYGNVVGKPTAPTNRDFTHSMTIVDSHALMDRRQEITVDLTVRKIWPAFSPRLRAAGIIPLSQGDSTDIQLIENDEVGKPSYSIVATNLPSGMSLTQSTNITDFEDVKLIGAPTNLGFYNVEFVLASAEGTEKRLSQPLAVLPQLTLSTTSIEFPEEEKGNMAYVGDREIQVEISGGAEPYTLGYTDRLPSDITAAIDVDFDAIKLSRTRAAATNTNLEGGPVTIYVYDSSGQTAALQVAWGASWGTLNNAVIVDKTSSASENFSAANLGVSWSAGMPTYRIANGVSLSLPKGIYLDSFGPYAGAADITFSGTLSEYTETTTVPCSLVFYSQGSHVTIEWSWTINV